ncbi:uncharacterized protein MYCFIDRAFT_176680 [Pseudocercospora fijiensis CIRAD86]|uniref:Uncharacterized protein n=1 Tax=Pseudocercospora fijiensis (strain CIRAD86) TaxID=383855 RepID=M3AW94_PSEFD|nr:uncharacterized protein MYCFIDRAFT_176680 [Pseudocercospora fijiensis CIRAD86]EME81403.1 hypothetical protein MYCFIDRAFT_176680 [Pseudocercospora fijiensis CIRAD86]
MYIHTSLVPMNATMGAQIRHSQLSDPSLFISYRALRCSSNACTDDMDDLVGTLPHSYPSALSSSAHEWIGTVAIEKANSSEESDPKLQLQGLNFKKGFTHGHHSLLGKESPSFNRLQDLNQAHFILQNTYLSSSIYPPNCHLGNPTHPNPSQSLPSHPLPPYFHQTDLPFIIPFPFLFTITCQTSTSASASPSSPATQCHTFLTRAWNFRFEMRLSRFWEHVDGRS